MRGNMLKTSIIAAGALALMAGSSLAADMPVVTKAPPAVGKAPVGGGFAVEYGGWVASDYVFRGTTQSNGGPSAGASFTAVWGNTFYLGVAGAAVDWPTTAAYNLSDPSAEIDFLGGLRFSSGKWSFDIGAIYYYYPKEMFFQSDFWEVYGIVKYAVTDQLVVGASINHSPDYLNYGIEGTTGALSFAWTTPTSYKDLSFFVSGDIGRVWLGDTSSPAGIFVPDYTYWSAGFGWTWKNITLDLRYHDTDLSGAGCQGIWNAVGSPGINSWCGDTYVAKLSFAGSTAN
jgi:uncharacterized protein (TIGR02001 family)